MSDKPDLTPQQQLFVDQYLIYPNAADAARRAGYSERSADQLGSRLLKEPEIAAAVKVAQDARAQRMAITQERVLAEFATIAFGDGKPRDKIAALTQIGRHLSMFTDNLNVRRPASDASDADLAAIALAGRSAAAPTTEDPQ